MTYKYLVTLLVCVVVLVLESEVKAVECPPGDSNGNCSLTTHNNEIDTLSTEQIQDLETHTPEPVTRPGSMNMLAEDPAETSFRPTLVSSSTESNFMDNSSSTSSSTESTTLPFISSINSTSMSTDSSTESTTLPFITSTNSTSTTTPSSTESITLPFITTMNSTSTSTSSSTENTTLLSITSSNSTTTTTSSSTESSTLPFITTMNSTSVSVSTSSSTESSTFPFITSTNSAITSNSTENSVTTLDSIEDLITTASESIIDLNPTENAITTSGYREETISPLYSQENENSIDKSTEMVSTGVAEEPKGRALNFTVEETDPSNILSNSSSRHIDDDFNLSDVNTHDDFDMDELNPRILASKMNFPNSTFGICEKGGLTYENGQKLELGCDSICTCTNGKMNCIDRCAGPYFRKGKKIEDPLCSEKEAEDPCCSILVCAGDTETEPLEMCSYNNQTYNRGDKFNKECTEVCSCEAAGKISCKPRCPPITKTSDRCVEGPDPNDSCCKKVFCDVTLDEHDTEKEDEKSKPKVVSATFINTTTVLLTFDSKFDDNESLPDIEVSNDKSDWKYYRLLPGGLLFVKSNAKYLKIENTDDIIEIQNNELGLKQPEEIKSDSECYYKGKTFKVGEEYNDDCNSLCICQESEMKCLKIQCPTYFGVDVLDPNCIEWETVPPDFVPSPPNCCPDKVRCKNNGSCDYEGRMYKNWDLLPANVTGCDKKCYCEMGKVECQNTCPPVTAFPPPNLPCSPNLAMLSHIPDDDCCKYWVCSPPDNAPETVHSHTDSDSKGQTANNSTDIYMGPFASKAPSKVLGPLAVYANEDNDQNIANNSLGIVHRPKVSPFENPFYHNNPSLPPDQHKPDISKPLLPKDKVPDYLGPFNTNTGEKKIGSPKYSQNKPTKKNSSLFITPPPLAKPTININETYYSNNIQPFSPFINTHPKHTININETYYSNNIKPNPFLNTQQSTGTAQINSHDNGGADEILQFIHQHPEIHNYPSGSVLEIHNLPPNSHPNQEFIDQNSPTRPKIHLVPYLVPQNSEGQPVNEDLPPGISLEQILQEFQKNSQAVQNNPLNFLHHTQLSNNGLMLHPHQNGPMQSNRHNITYTGMDDHMFPGNFPGFPAQHPQDEITIQTLEAIDPHKVRLAFTVPSVIVGLHGRFEVRYTHNKEEDDLESWMLTVFAPPNDLIATPSLVFDLTDLKADTEYKIKVTATLRDLHNSPSSKVYKIATPKEADPPVIPIDPDLAITDINATWVTVVWRAFTQYELQFIDGIQLRYKEIDGRIYTATPLIHRAVTRFTLEKLKPNTKYEIGIYFIPFPGQMTELHTENILHFTTANEIDTYGFNVTLEISQLKSQSVEISWNGVPYPEDKYVNIYRAIYQSDSGKEDHSTFKIAKRDSATKTIIRDLKPGTRYRLWLEVYLTNGKIKTSNVEDFITKPRIAPALGASTQQDKLARAEIIESKGDYYGPLVIVAILAAIAILSTLILLLILVRRHNQNKASITPPSTRISQSAYDNPTYKVEIQQETMGL